MIRKPKGTEDILPSEINNWQYIEDVARYLLESYNFKEVRTPMFESFDLFSRSVGETTDIVSKEMYDFFDKGERHITLRPEGTAPIARAYIENKLYGPEFPNPYKIFYIGPMFRYERPQAGRQRQFHQLGVEVFGTSNPAVDVESIALAWDYFQELGIDNLSLCVNSLGKTADRQNYRQALVDYFKPLKDQLSIDSQRRLEDNPLRIIDSKDPQDIKIVQSAPSILDYLSSESKEHFAQVQELLTAIDIPFTIAPNIVRGLDYYQDTIFEIIVTDDSIGSQSTVCGGGRYDGLVEELGGPQTAGFGFAIGLERLLILMEEQDIEIPEEDGLDLFVMTMGEESNEMALQLVQAARGEGLTADRDYLNRSIKSQYNTAEKQKTKTVITVGDNEVASGQLKMKELASGKQIDFSLEEFMEDSMAIYRKLTIDTSVIDKYFEGGL